MKVNREEIIQKLDEKYNDKEVNLQLRFTNNGRITKDLDIGKVYVHFGNFISHICFAYHPGNLLCINTKKVVAFRDDLARVDLMILLQEEDFEK